MLKTIYVSLLVASVCLVSVSAQALTFSFTTLDYPGAVSTYAFGISGGRIVGSYEDASGVWHGFVYDGANYTSLDFPGAGATYANGIDGGMIVGGYRDQNSINHGFLATPVPEPSTLLLFGVGLMGVGLLRRKLR